MQNVSVQNVSVQKMGFERSSAETGVARFGPSKLRGPVLQNGFAIIKPDVSQSGTHISTYTPQRPVQGH